MSGFRQSGFGCVAVVAALVVGQGCAAATYQDAKLIGKGNWELTPSVTRVGIYDDGDSAAIGTAVGGTVTTGLSEKVDISAGYARFSPKGIDAGLNFAGVAPKISLKKDRTALLLPISFAFGNDVDSSESLQFSPAAIFSIPVSDSVTFNPGAKAVFSKCDDCDVLVGAQAGLSISLASGKVILRPEFGTLFNLGESGFVWTFGIGLSVRPR